MKQVIALFISCLLLTVTASAFDANDYDYSFDDSDYEEDYDYAYDDYYYDNYDVTAYDYPDDTTSNFDFFGLDAVDLGGGVGFIVIGAIILIYLRNNRK